MKELTKRNSQKALIVVRKHQLLKAVKSHFRALETNFFESVISVKF